MSDTCDYLAQHNTPCGAPATHRYFTAAKCWFYLCPDHCGTVYRNTKGKTNPTPLVTTILAEKSDTHVARAVTEAIAAEAAKPRPVYNPVIPVVTQGKSLSQLYAEMQQARSEGGDLT